MCYALYIGTESPCETTKWDEYNRKFYIEGLHSRDKCVLENFTKPNVYYAGSWQGCGCGFFSEPEWTETAEELEEIENTKRCISDLAGFLSKKLENTNEIELFVCWEGDQGGKPERKIEKTPNELLGHSLPLDEMDFVIIKKNRTV